MYIFKEMIVHEGDRLMCLQGTSHCGDNCQSRGNVCAAVQFALCCLECRTSLPTNSEKTVPWIVNCCGVTLWYQWALLPCTFLSTIGELKEDTKEHQNPWSECCESADQILETPSQTSTRAPTEASSEISRISNMVTSTLSSAVSNQPSAPPSSAVVQEEVAGNVPLRAETKEAEFKEE